MARTKASTRSKSRKGEQSKIEDWQKVQESVRARTIMAPIETVHKNPWNPNEQNEEMQEAIIEGMRRRGAEGTDPVIVRPMSVIKGVQHYQILDGGHRYDDAVELEWSHIKLFVEDEMDDPTAMALCWSLNARRGRMSWFKEAVMFNEISEKYGVPFDAMAEKFITTKNYIERRVSILILGMDNCQKAQQMGVAFGTLERIAKIKDPVKRQKALDTLLNPDASEKEKEDVKEEVKEITTKKRKCPECGEEQESPAKYVRCKKGHYFPVKKPKGEKKDKTPDASKTEEKKEEKKDEKKDG